MLFIHTTNFSIATCLLTIAVECGDPPNFKDGTKCGGVKLPPGKKRCNWNDGHDFWGGIPQYNTNITYECPEG